MILYPDNNVNYNNDQEIMIRRGAVVLLMMIFLGGGNFVSAQAPNEQGFEIVKNLDIFSNVMK